MKVQAIGYVRVSTEDQATEGVSLAQQERQLKAYCRAKGWPLVEVCRDEGVSAKTLERPGLQAALAALGEGKANALVVTKLDRLSRSVRDILGLVEERFAHNGCNLVSIGENLDATNAMGKFVLTIMAGLAQMEREQIGERTRAALAYVKGTGKHLGAVPIGKQRGGGGRLVTDDDEQAKIAHARRLRRDGYTLQQVGEKLGWTVAQVRMRVNVKYRKEQRERARKAAAKKRAA